MQLISLFQIGIFCDDDLFKHKDEAKTLWWGLVSQFPEEAKVWQETGGKKEETSGKIQEAIFLVQTEQQAR